MTWDMIWDMIWDVIWDVMWDMIMKFLSIDTKEPLHGTRNNAPFKWAKTPPP